MSTIGQGLVTPSQFAQALGWHRAATVEMSTWEWASENGTSARIDGHARVHLSHQPSGEWAIVPLDGEAAGYAERFDAVRAASRS